MSFLASLPFGRSQLSKVTPVSSVPRPLSHAGLKNVISGRVVSADNPSGHPDLKLSFFTRGYFFGLVPMGSIRTDSAGKFTFRCHLEALMFSNTIDLVIKVINDFEVFPGQNARFLKIDIPVDEMQRRMDVRVNNIDLGDLQTKVNVVSTDLTNVPAPLPDQLPYLSYFLHFGTASLKELPKKLIVSVFGKYLNASQVQRIYDTTLGGLLGRTYPKVELTKELLFDELQNRICHSDYVIENDQIIFSTNWDEADFIRKDSLAHMKVVFKNAKEGVEFDSISRRYPDETTETVSRSGDATFPKALKDAFNNFSYEGEGRYHLGVGHILVLVPAETKDEHLSETNPVARVLAPHLRGTVFIDNLGKKGIVFGQGGVLSNSAYSVDGVNKLILKAAADKANWQSYTTAAPISVSDRRSRTEAICFDVYNKFFTQYIDNNKDEISKYWVEIYNWSRHMTSLMPSLPLITARDENPTPEDFANLIKFCAWLVNTTTFIHWSAHSRQQLLTDVSQASLAVRNKGYAANGEVDPFNGTTVEDANTQLFVSRVLLDFQDPGMFGHPSLVDPLLISCFNERLAELKSYYPDFENMYVSVDI